MTCRSAGRLVLVLTGVAALGVVAGRFGSQPHAEMAAAAAGLMLAATVAAGVAEATIARGGGEALVLAYWVGVGVRGVVGVSGLMVLARHGFESQDRPALVLWVLTAYQVALVYETVRAVRDADRVRRANTRRAGGVE